VPRALIAGAAALLVLAGCGRPLEERTSVERVPVGAVATQQAPAAHERALAVPVHQPVSTVRSPAAVLAKHGYTLEYATRRRDVMGNMVILDLYVGPEIRSPRGEPRGRADLYFNAAQVDGLAAKVDDDLSELSKLDELVDPDAEWKVQEVEVDGRPAVLVHEGVGRFVVTARGEWRIQVSTGAPADVLSDDTLIEIAGKAQVR